MKHNRILIAMLLIIALLLTGCGKVTETEEAIAAIGTVTMDSLPSIIYAEQLLGELSESQQAKVENLDVLTDAREAYDKMEAAITHAETAIAAIGTVTADSGQQIQAAKDAYYALISQKLDSHVAHLLPILDAAEESYELIQIQGVFDEAVAVYDSGSYSEALDLFDAFIADYPESELIPSANEMAVSCCLHLIEVELEKGELETSLYVIEEIPEYYGGDSYTTEFIQMRTRIYDKLAEIRPETGYYLVDNLDSGYPEFTLENQSEYDVCVKLESVEDPEDQVMFFVRSDETHTFNLESGTYTLKYCAGKYWFNDEDMFGNASMYVSSDGTIELETIYYGGSVQYSAFTYTINPASGNGNASISDLDPNDF